MEQEITSEKKKELELNLKSKKSMFNVKIFSLMKKQLFSLVMVLALIVMAGTGALAQNTGWSQADAIWHLPGSSHVVQVESHVGSTYTWTIQAVTCAGVPGATTTGHVGGSTTNSETITYDETASGMYRITCDEDNGCHTIREFFTSIMSIDVVAYASDAAGVTLGAGPLASCNDYALPTMNNSNLVTNDVLEDGGATSALFTAFHRNDRYNERYVTVRLDVTDGSGCAGIAGAPAADDFNWTFDYTIAGTNIDATNFRGFGTLPAWATNATPTALTGAIVVTAQAGSSTVIMPLQTLIRWGLTDTDQDQVLGFTVDTGSAMLDGSDTDNTYDDGTEPTTPAAITDNNVTEDQLINASPATSRIVIND
jgi:hypothetical protein